MHTRNRHKHGYDFDDLIRANPELTKYVIKNKYNQQDTIDFSNPDAVKSLNYSLLKSLYQINHWNIPNGYLCPAIPGRADYIHHLKDLLNSTSNVKTTDKQGIKVLDIGTGASCIYPILGQKEYGWNFVATDVDPISIKAATEIITNNDTLVDNIQCRLQNSSEHIFDGIIKDTDYFHLTLCNPPFHKSLTEASKGTKQKWSNLAKTKVGSPKTTHGLNFGGQKAELWCPGGELAFLKTMIKESRHFKGQVLWFTCLISKKEHVSKVKFYLKKAQASRVKVVNMAQGNKISRFIAWSFI